MTIMCRWRCGRGKILSSCIIFFRRHTKSQQKIGHMVKEKGPSVYQMWLLYSLTTIGYGFRQTRFICYLSLLLICSWRRLTFAPSAFLFSKLLAAAQGKERRGFIVATPSVSWDIFCASWIAPSLLTQKGNTQGSLMLFPHQTAERELSTMGKSQTLWLWAGLQHNPKPKAVIWLAKCHQWATSQMQRNHQWDFSTSAQQVSHLILHLPSSLS